jgi:hypothetical protein
MASKKVVKKTEKVDLNKMLTFDQKKIDKACKSYENKLSFREGLISLLSNKRVMKELSDKCCCSVSAGHNGAKELRIEFVLGNDKTKKATDEFVKEKLSELLGGMLNVGKC